MKHISKASGDVQYEFAGYKFIWNGEKARLNLKKHGIAFEEAATVIVDELTLYIRDDSHSNEEERFKAIGFSAKNRMLTVCHCVREDDMLFRIITAWKATAAEKDLYEKSIGD